jgi:hypothetical protein
MPIVTLGCANHFDYPLEAQQYGTEPATSKDTQQTVSLGRWEVLLLDGKVVIPFTMNILTPDLLPRLPGVYEGRTLVAGVRYTTLGRYGNLRGVYLEEAIQWFVMRDGTASLKTELGRSRRFEGEWDP